MNAGNKTKDWMTTTIERYTDIHESENAVEVQVVYKHLLFGLFYPSDYPGTRDKVYVALTKKIAHAWLQRKNYRLEEVEILSSPKNWDQIRVTNMAHTATFLAINTMALGVKMHMRNGHTYLELYYTLVGVNDKTSSTNHQWVVN